MPDIKYLPIIATFAICLFFPSCRKNNDTTVNSTTTTTTNVPPDFKYYGYTTAGDIIEFNFLLAAKNEVWDFGDGTIKQWPGGSKTNFISHTYKAEGTYTVSVIPDNDATKKVTKVLAIKANYSFYYTGVPVAGDTVYFKFPAYLSPANSYSWTFGDGGTSSDSTPYHVYTVPGTYHVDFYVNGAYNNFLWDGIHIYRDPVYTHNAAQTRQFHCTNRVTVNNNAPTYGTLPDATLAISYVNKITLKFNYGNYVFDDVASSADNNELYFVYKPYSVDGRIYYNRAKDSISVYTVSTMGGLGTPPTKTETFYTSF